VRFYQIDEKNKKVECYNERWYSNADKTKWYRNITTILGTINKGYQYDEWLKNVGHNSEIIVDRAGKLGTVVHSLIERTLLGDKISFNGLIAYGEQQATAYWERYLIWCKFWKEFNETYEVEYQKEGIEYIALSDKHTYGCTVDLIAKIKDRKKKNAEQLLVDIDWKTGNSIHDASDLQIVAGMRAIEEQTGQKFNKGLIVHMPFDKPNKKGYRLHEVENSDELFSLVVATKKIYDYQNKGTDPKFLTYPMEIDLEYIKNNNIIEEK
jgi:hypothetical protein